MIEIGKVPHAQTNVYIKKQRRQKAILERDLLRLRNLNEQRVNNLKTCLLVVILLVLSISLTTLIGNYFISLLQYPVNCKVAVYEGQEFFQPSCLRCSNDKQPINKSCSFS